MKKQRAKIHKNEDGQALIMVVLAIVVLMGIAALVVDVGILYVEKANMQKAADAAALAGAQDLPANTAIITAENYGALNGAHDTDANLTDDKSKVEVECTKTVPHYFARILGFTETEVSASAIAEKQYVWEGEGLPFINFHESFLEIGTQVEVWDKVSSGYFQSIENFDVINEGVPNNTYFQLHIEDGLQVKNGKVANKKKAIENYYNTHKSTLTPTPYVYIFSLSPKAFDTEKVILQNGSQKNINDLINKSDYVSLKSLVLVKCTFDYYDDKILKLTSVKTYDLGNDDVGYPNLPDYPTDYVGPNGSGSQLIE
ncbi:putative Flp pilus-assembly TadE/G-like protein [Alkalibaculum bacchi]|uniref:Putative Flp pilus-assembly TadE/G-like protein n=1 Tax=Alkalibaculum bacchi TaxID=645887 RepID=A0A366IAW6_9FIRM|nr:pilus assembly protein TadG-related protein [Alkalibaculum bacchi]RBP66003.1 putative Flp pilus-assembly TadE/G-like protein [Alkalibaculum bacchi]